MNINVEEKNSVVLISLEGEMIGGPAAAQLSEKLHELCDNNKKKILVDLQNIDWMNSSGLGILIGSLTTLRNCGGEFKLLHLSKKVGELLKITKLDRVFDIFEDEGEAIASFS